MPFRTPRPLPLRRYVWRCWRVPADCALGSTRLQGSTRGRNSSSRCHRRHATLSPSLPRSVGFFGATGLQWKLWVCWAGRLESVHDFDEVARFAVRFKALRPWLQTRRNNLVELGNKVDRRILKLPLARIGPALTGSARARSSLSVRIHISSAQSFPRVADLSLDIAQIVEDVSFRFCESRFCHTGSLGFRNGLCLAVSRGY